MYYRNANGKIEGSSNSAQNYKGSNDISPNSSIEPSYNKDNILLYVSIFLILLGIGSGYYYLKNQKDEKK